MNASLALQYAVVAVVVALAAVSVLRRYLPSLWGRGLACIADALEAAPAAIVLHRLGARLRARIPASVGSACATSGSCSSCGACTTVAEVKPATLVLTEPKPVRRS
ncbi:MAG: hypothetical protein JNN30_11500 [Rhodanobacteraceae bacterium]|nr:hypothetical protein [Rhodanobacteraceae bacterium]